MSSVTHILDAIDQGDPRAAAELLPLVYDELRKLASQKLAHEKPGQTLDATALVHEAYIRLVASGGRQPPVLHEQGADAPRSPEVAQFANRTHFFAAAAEAMRRILVENARRKKRFKHGGGQHRVDLEAVELTSSLPDDDLLALDEALTKLKSKDPEFVRLIHLRFFLGMTTEEAAELLGVAAITAKRHWRFARAWLRRELCELGEPGDCSPTD